MIIASEVSRDHLLNHAARLDHPACRDEVALPPPLEVEPADPREAAQEEDPEAPPEDRAQEPERPVVRHLSVHEGDEGARPDNEQEPARGLDEREPVPPPDEEHPLAGGEERREAGRVVRGGRGSCGRLGHLARSFEADQATGRP